MKTILVPTDFSVTAYNALRYAAELAGFSQTKLILFHAYHIPVPTTEIPVMLISPEELENENKQRIKKFEKEVSELSSNKLKVESIVKQGFATDEILDLIKKKKIDMVVMGMKGENELGKIIGSIVTSVMKKATCPVIVVPEKAKFQQIKKIVYACDYEKIYDHSALEPLWELARIHDAEIMVFNVRDSRVHPSTEQAIEGIRLDHWLGRVKHSYWFSEKSDVVEAINDFVKKNHAVMIAMVGHKHSFPENLIHRSVTKRMAFHTHIPLLVLHVELKLKDNETVREHSELR